jgi:diaminopimelate decarboxylase
VRPLDARACVEISDRVATPSFVLFPELFRQLVEIVGSSHRITPRLHLAYPIKTMPLAYWLRAWRKLGRYAEASSECELQLALQCGFSAERIIVSGPGKLAWMRSLRLRHLSLVFDSATEAEGLASMARRYGWRVGLRFAPKHQVDPDNTAHLDQFGIDVREWRPALVVLQRAGVRVQLLQFHLGGWRGDAEGRVRALEELADLARAGSLEPTAIDVGGGFPQAYRARDAVTTARRARVDLRRLERVAQRLFPSCREIIAECGRVILGPTAVLLLRVVDVKVKYGQRFIICDGGRVNHALPSDWEEHDVYFPNSAKNTRRSEATVCGPTCMAWDFISRRPVPIDIQPGHFVVYDAAGAYHWPWQSSFSQRRAAAALFAEHRRHGVRVQRLIDRQSIAEWLAQCGQA